MPAVYPILAPLDLDADARPVQLAEILSALTFALDLTEGARPGHSLRCCLLGMRIGFAAGLSLRDLASLYYALQLKDAGCSSNASTMTGMLGGGDERLLKNAAKLTDWTRPHRPDPRYLRELWRQCRPGASVAQRAQHLFRLATTPRNYAKDLFQQRCERGAEVAEHLQLGGPVAEAVRSLDEHWDGSGYPHGKRGEEISPLSRICLVAQHLDSFAVAEGPHRAVQTLSTHCKAWYDPNLIAVVRSLHKAGQLWDHCRPTDSVEDTRKAVLARDPGMITNLTADRVDSICEAFAGIVDAKSPFTYRHSLGVMQVACAIARELGLSTATCDTIRRAALLHDIGKLAISNAILDKNGKLTETEWAAVRTHPEISGTILRRIGSFGTVALLAEQHHERLDGTGYPFGQSAADLSLESRIIAIADCYAAMAENRPYRDGKGKDQVLSLLTPDVPKLLDADCFAALQSAARRWTESFPPQAATGTERPESPKGALNWSWPSLAESTP